MANIPTPPKSTVQTLALAGATFAAAGVAVYGSVGAAWTALLGVSAGTWATGALVVAAIKAAMGSFRLVPFATILVAGKPVMGQLSFGAGFKNLLTSASLVVAAIQVVIEFEKLLIGKIKKKLSSQNGVTNINEATLSSYINNTRYNKFTESLDRSLDNLAYFSTATSSSTIYLNWNTSTAVGTSWWNFRNDMASTATGSYQSIFYTAKYFTDAISGVSPNGSIMSIDDILMVQSESSTATEAFGLTVEPTLDNFASTFKDATFIQNAVDSLTLVLEDANTSTTTQAILDADIAQFQTYIAALVNQIDLDVSNQARFISQANQLSTIENAARLLNTIRDNHSGDTFSLYRETLNPDLEEIVYGVSLKQRLLSSNTATVAATIKEIQETQV